MIRQSSTPADVQGAAARFLPGDPDSFVLPGRWGGTVRAVEPPRPGTVCEAEVPCRLHASVLDMTRFDLGKPGGGGIGFGVGLYCSSRVVITGPGPVVASGDRPALAHHLAALFRSLTGWPTGVEIEVRDHGRRHMGLGSSIGTMMAAAVALNEAFGRPLGLRDLRKLVAHNYCEEVGRTPAVLSRAFETNVGAMVALHGGMVVASDGCELVCRIPLPETMRALLLLPPVGPRTAGTEEARALLGTARELDRRDAPAKAHKVFLDLVPAALRGDLRAVGRVIAEISAMGSKRAEVELHGNRGREIRDLMRRLQEEAGAEIVGMSSVGPAVFALSREPGVWSRWRGLRDPALSTCTLEVPVDNAGARVRLDGVPVAYRLEPWWEDPPYAAGPPAG